jgi:hypothetical protein
MLARTGERISGLLDTVAQITERLYQHDMVGNYKVQKITHYDGTKIFLENDNWAP